MVNTLSNSSIVPRLLPRDNKQTGVGYTTTPGKFYQKYIHDQNGEVVFYGNCHEVFEWLRETEKVTF